MHKTTENTRRLPGDAHSDPEVLAFRHQFDDRSPLDGIINEGARRMLLAAIDAEVEAFIEALQN
nr:hypothetical protein [Symmachiella dynata]